MAIIRRVMRWSRCEDTGEEGFIPWWFNYAQPTSGSGVFHDVMDHFMNEPGRMEGECMAYGSLYYTRGENGLVGNGYLTLREILRNEFHEFLRETWDGGIPLKTPPVSAPLRGSRYGDRFLREVMNAAIESMQQAEEFVDDVDITDEDKALIQKIGKHMLDWVRIGYRKARRRYSDCPCLYSLGSMRDRFGADYDKVTANAEQYHSVHIEVDTKRITYQIQLKDASTKEVVESVQG